MVKKVKLYGCRHSGTKYMTQLLELNWQVEVASKEFGHKHEVPLDIPKNIPVIIIHKHPCAYILSAYDRKWSSQDIKHLVNEYISKYSKWSLLAQKQGVLINYEHLLSNFDKTMKYIEKSLNLVSKQNSYKNINKYCGNQKRKIKKQFYLNKEYLYKISKNDLQYIKNRIPKTLLDILGYDL